MNLDRRFLPIQQEARILEGVFEVSKYCLYQCSNEFREGECYSNCLQKWSNAQLLARTVLGQLVERNFKENPKSF